MLETLSKGFRAARQRLSGVAELNDDIIDEALRDVRLSLLEGDVEFRVVKRFMERVKTAAQGKQVELRAKSKEYGTKTITPEQAFIAICQDELVKMMGPVDTEFRWAKKGPTGIMMCGLQGSGKTTTTGKLARYLEKTHKKKPLLVAADIYRPAAVEQLKTLGRQLNMPVWSMEGKDPVTICKEAEVMAAREGCDVIIYDTAGRLAIDEPLMQELEDIDKSVTPANIFLVLDAMTGQDAVNVADTFNKRLNLDGVIMTKLDGDARGALRCRSKKSPASRSSSSAWVNNSTSSKNSALKVWRRGSWAWATSSAWSKILSRWSMPKRPKRMRCACSKASSTCRTSLSRSA